MDQQPAVDNLAECPSDSRPTVIKQQQPTKGGRLYPQLLRLSGELPARAQSCTDFGQRLPSLLPSSLAAAALSAKRIQESGGADSPLPFAPFSPQSTGGTPMMFTVADHHHRHHQLAEGANSAPSLSPQCQQQQQNPLPATQTTNNNNNKRKCSRSSRLASSFRRTLKGANPKRLLAQSDSNNSAPASTSGGGTTTTTTVAIGQQQEQQQNGPRQLAGWTGGVAANEDNNGGCPPAAGDDSRRGSWSTAEQNGTREGQGQNGGGADERLLTRAWQMAEHKDSGSRRRESRIMAPPPQPEQQGEVGGGKFLLRRLSKAFFLAQAEQRTDLMNDWEIGGTQNPWVCPSDRHLQLRAQLKSGWSVRTATARSPTTSKQALVNGAITEAEQEQIQRVLARAEQGRQNEQQRIGKMVERLDRLRQRATGNGLTQCLLCQTEFGLLAAKSYAAMCSDCRKYVCQRNCGVETFDQKRKEPVFLCKICSEYREVMWKKSGAWFYREMPPATGRPSSALAGGPCSSPSPLPLIANGGPPSFLGGSQQQPQQGGGCGLSPRLSGSHSGPIPRRQMGSREGRQDSRESRGRRELPIPSEPHQQRLKTTPRPRIIPSWVHDGLPQSSLSVDDSDAEEGCSCSSSSSSTCSSLEPAQFRKSLGAAKERALAVKQRAIASLGGGGGNNHQLGGSGRHSGANGRTGAVAGNNPLMAGATAIPTLQRVVLGRRGVTDSESDEGEQELEPLSRRSSLSPSTSPRHSLATPSSFGGDDLLSGGGGGHQFPGGGGALFQTGICNPGQTGGGGMVHYATAGGDNDRHTMSDSRSVDSGVVQSDHSAQQQLLQHTGTMGAENPSSPGGLAAFAQQQQQHQQRASIQSPSPGPPPIPPRSATITAPVPAPKPSPAVDALSNCVQQQTAKRPSSASAFPSVWPPAVAAAAISKSRANGPQAQNSHSSHESIPSSSGGVTVSRTAGRMPGGVAGEGSGRASNSSLLALTVAPDTAAWCPATTGSRRSTQSTLDNASGGRKGEQQQKQRLSVVDAPAVGDGEGGDGAQPPLAESPTFMSSPEDDSSTLGSIQFNLTYMAEEKQLLIHLIRAKNLKAMDKNGFSDPYVKFHLLPGNTKATKLTSKTIEKTLNPEWNQELSYHGISEEERLRKTLRITVLDRDRIGSDFLGETRVALRKLPPGQVKRFNLYLEHAMPVPPLDNPDQAQRGKCLLAVCYNIQQGSLFVTIKRCAELLGMDSTGFSDPYCKVSLTPLSSKAHRQKTSIKKRTLNPEFNETLQFIVPFRDLPRKTLEIGVYDYDVGRHDDYIGGIVLSTTAPGSRGEQWQQVIGNPGKSFECWHMLEADD